MKCLTRMQQSQKLSGFEKYLQDIADKWKSANSRFQTWNGNKSSVREKKNLAKKKGPEKSFFDVLKFRLLPEGSVGYQCSDGFVMSRRIHNYCENRIEIE